MGERGGVGRGRGERGGGRGERGEEGEGKGGGGRHVYKPLATMQPEQHHPAETLQKAS